jgi:ribosome-associated translation inhibitor RaiA/cold shock CspA family protein
VETPLQITFHNIEPSPAVEADIRERVEKLEQKCERLVGCRVAVEARHKQHRQVNVYECHIDLRVPTGEIVVSNQPRRVKENYANPDVYVSIREAFAIAERKLKRFKQRLGGEVKRHPPLFQGEVVELNLAEGFGFIITHEGTRLYFHRNSLMNEDFNRLEPGTAVHFIEALGDTGPTACKVWRGPDYHLD